MWEVLSNTCSAHGHRVLCCHPQLFSMSVNLQHEALRCLVSTSVLCLQRVCGVGLCTPELPPCQSTFPVCTCEGILTVNGLRVYLCPGTMPLKC